jgi:hypothetical protein
MEQALWPEDYERMTREVEEALREADAPNAGSYSRGSHAGDAGTHRPSVR